MSRSINNLGDLFNKTFLGGIDMRKYVEGNSPSYEDHMRVKQKIVDDINMARDYPQHIDCETSYDQKNTLKIYSTKKQPGNNHNEAQNHKSGLQIDIPVIAKPVDTSNSTLVSQVIVEPVQGQVPKFHAQSSNETNALKPGIAPAPQKPMLTPNSYPNQHITGTSFEQVASRSESIDITIPPYYQQYHQIITPQDPRFSQQDMQYVAQTNMYYHQQNYSQKTPPIPPIQQFGSNQSIPLYQPFQQMQSIQTYQQIQFQQPPSGKPQYVGNSYVYQMSQNSQKLQVQQKQSSPVENEHNRYLTSVSGPGESNLSSPTFVNHYQGDANQGYGEYDPHKIGAAKPICKLDLNISRKYVDTFKFYGFNSEEITMEFVASLDGKFYSNTKYLKVGDDDDTSPIACYRRNYNSMLISLFFSETPKFLEVSGIYYEISNIKLSLDAKSNFSQSPIELAYFDASNTERYPSNFITMNDASIDLGVFSRRKNIKIRRFQFKKATPNNGKNIAKDYYYLFLTLSFDLLEGNSGDSNKRKLPFNQKLITLKTNGISVRGRNPSFYTERNDESIRKDTSVCFKYFNGLADI